MSNKLVGKIESNRAMIRWHKLAIIAIMDGLPEDRINVHSVPINVFSAKTIDEYTECLQMELDAFVNGEPSPFANKLARTKRG